MRLDNQMEMYAYYEGRRLIYKQSFMSPSYARVSIESDNSITFRDVDNWAKERLIKSAVPDTVSVNDFIDYFGAIIEEEYEKAVQEVKDAHPEMLPLPPMDTEQPTPEQGTDNAQSNS